MYYCIREIDDKRVLIVLYALTATYFAGVMVSARCTGQWPVAMYCTRNIIFSCFSFTKVRLVLVLTPVVCVLAGIAVSEVLSRYIFNNPVASPRESGKSDKRRSDESSGERQLFDEAGKLSKPYDARQAGSGGGPISGSGGTRSSAQHEHDPTGIGMSVRNIVFFLVCILLILFVMHSTWITSNAYSSPSIVLATYGQDGSREMLDDFREGYGWLRMNTRDDARVMSWWDYGYQVLYRPAAVLALE